MKYIEIEGDLIELAKQGKFDVITHGVNCFCTMGAGIAVPMSKFFGVNTFEFESGVYYGDINKLGNIDFEVKTLTGGTNEFDFFEFDLTIINSYTQFKYGRGLHLDYEALTLCLRKINSLFKGKHIGLPLIGGGLAGGDKNTIIKIIKSELVDMDVTLVLK